MWRAGTTHWSALRTILDLPPRSRSVMEQMAMKGKGTSMTEDGQVPGKRVSRIARFLGIEAREVEPVAIGMAMFFLLFAGYFLLRPVRETMGIAGGVNNLQWLFTG